MLCITASMLGGFWIVVRSGEGFELIAVVVSTLWVFAPTVAAAALVGASSTRLGAASFLVLEIGLIASIVWLVVEYAYIHPSSTGSLALIVLTFYQVGALLVVFVFALLFGWRMRPDFLKD